MESIHNQKKSRGAIVAFVVVFMTIFMILLGALVNYIISQLHTAQERVAWNEALEAAEAGIQYYRWCLNNGVQAKCVNQKSYTDPEGNSVGTFSIQANNTLSCNQVTSWRISSTGWTQQFPQVKRTINVLYGRPSVAKYSYLLNSSVWAGADRQISGLYHSNGGIRMDGHNQSLVTSGSSQWVCTSSFGCSTCPTGNGCALQGGNCTCPGVFTTTSNANSGLFQYPIPPFDFNGITVDLAQLKTVAQASGIYLPPSVNLNSQAKGYHLKLKSDGTMEAWIITGLTARFGYSLEEGWHNDNFIISNEFLYHTYTISSLCSAIFVEDNLWIEGVAKGKITIASASISNPNKTTDVVLPGNVDYTVQNGSDELAVIGQRNILISPIAPSQMVLRGVYIAQKGRFGINHYNGNLKTSLDINGSIVSNGRTGTQWTSGGQIISGYLQRNDYTDSHLIYEPPPFVPNISTNFQILDWKEQ